MKADDTILVELLPEHVLILIQLLEQKMNANQDVRIKSAYAGIVRAIQKSYLEQNESTMKMAGPRPGQEVRFRHADDA